MTVQRWQRVEHIFYEALKLSDHERLAYVRDACALDEELRNEVESLLACDSHSEQQLNARAREIIGGVLAPDGLTGKTLGAYRINALVGSGGMGEVYSATDTKLRREVALKVLPASFVSDPDRIARFQREARILAALNHRNIATIHGLEQIGDIHFLVMEFVHGETLADRIAKRRPIRVDEALRLCRQLADALDAAHDQLIVHRDLKPANIKVTPDGEVKVLDFGLAKAKTGSAPTEATESNSESSLSTREGLIIGTPAYMCPEQARGKTVDKRADIWSFGCVLYELLTGAAAFGGETPSDRMAAVLERTPDWTVLPTSVSPRLRELLQQCLQKDPRERLRDIGDARLLLERLERENSRPIESIEERTVSRGAATIRVLSVDDHPMLRDGIAALIADQSDMTLVAEAANGREAIAQFRIHRPDVTLMDLQMPEVNGVEATAAIRSEFSNARIVVLTTYAGDAQVALALKAGASGYILKNSIGPELLATIRAVHAGRLVFSPEVTFDMANRANDMLSPSETRVLRLVAEGLSNKEIAAKLSLTEEMVKTHVKSIISKFGARDRTHAAMLGVRNGIIEV